MSAEFLNIELSDVLAAPDAFVGLLRAAKSAMADVNWYPYDSIAAWPLLKKFTEGVVIPANHVLDVGAADGDLSFLVADAGARVHALENAQTNFNGGEGLRRLNEAFGEPVSLSFMDLDFGFAVPDQYDLCFAMGIAYHLRNVPLFYLTLAEHCRFMITNTRVINVTPAGTKIGSEALAYILERRAFMMIRPTTCFSLRPVIGGRLIVVGGTCYGSFAPIPLAVASRPTTECGLFAKGCRTTRL
jgi:hypothetical protein